MCFWKKEQVIEEPKSITRDKIDSILDLIVDLTPAQFKSLIAGIEKFYDGYRTIKGVKTKDEKKQEKNQKEMQEIEDIENKLAYEKSKEKKK